MRGTSDVRRAAFRAEKSQSTDEFLAVHGLHNIHGGKSCAETQEREAMSYEKIFEYDLDITGVTDYGANMEAMFTGRESVPLQGAQFDVTLAGPVKGRVTGNLRGIDYLRVRPDGRRELLLTAAAAYSWVNAKPAWGSGYANLAANKIHVVVYLHCGAGRRPCKPPSARQSWTNAAMTPFAY